MPLPRPSPRPLGGDESGVASTIGTVMALLVFLTFLSLIINQYVPVWMKDSEAAHMNGAFGQFGTLKSGVDLQVLAAVAAQQSGTRYVPVTTFAPITLGVDGVPIFAGPTIGDLRLLPVEAPWTLEFVYSINGVPTKVSERSSGQVVLEVHNRYFVPETLVYDAGAVIRSQAIGQAVRAEPAFEVTKASGTVNVAFTLISLYGSGTVSGTSTDGVSTKLLGVDRQDYATVRSKIWVNHTTPFGLAWYGLFNTTLAKAFAVTPDKFATCSSFCYTAAYSAGQPTLLQTKTPYYEVKMTWPSAAAPYLVAVEVKNDWQNLDPIALAIGATVVQHAFVNVAVGTSVQDVQV